MKSLKIKVLTVNCTDKGSTGSIIDNIEKQITNQVEFVHVYEYGNNSSRNRIKLTNRFEYSFLYIFSRLIGIKHGTGMITTLRLKNIISKESPDLIHIHCPYSNTINVYSLFDWLAKNGYPMIITNHAEFFYTGNCQYSFDCVKFQTGCGNCTYSFDSYRRYHFDRTAFEWKCMKNSINKLKRVAFVAVSSWQAEKMKNSPILADKPIITIRNGIDTDVFSYDLSDIFHGLQINRKKRVLHVTAHFSLKSDDIKGGRYIIEIARAMPGVDFIVVGSCANVDFAKMPSNISFYGVINDKSVLSKIYSSADVTVVTSRCETFGMVIAESLCCGTPIIGFKAGGPESYALPQYSEFVDYPDVNSIINKINEFPIYSAEEKKRISDDAKKEYTSKDMAHDYYELYKSIVKQREY